MSLRFQWGLSMCSQHINVSRCLLALLTLQAIYVTHRFLLESTAQLNDRCCMCFDGGLQKLTKHGRQGMRHWLYVMGLPMVTKIGDCAYDKPSLSCMLGVYLFTTFAAAVVQSS